MQFHYETNKTLYTKNIYSNLKNTGDCHHHKYDLTITKVIGHLRPIRITITYYQAIGFQNNADTNICCQFPKHEFFQC